MSECVNSLSVLLQSNEKTFIGWNSVTEKNVKMSDLKYKCIFHFTTFITEINYRYSTISVHFNPFLQIAPFLLDTFTFPFQPLIVLWLGVLTYGWQKKGQWPQRKPVIGSPWKLIRTRWPPASLAAKKLLSILSVRSLLCSAPAVRKINIKCKEKPLFSPVFFLAHNLVSRHAAHKLTSK